MADEPTYDDIEDLLSDLEKAAAQGKKRSKGRGLRNPRKGSSTFLDSEATKQVKELEIEAIERKQAMEDRRQKDLRKNTRDSKQAEEAVHEMIEKYLTE